jgi:ABC-type glycerol-3-phosphate transport system permease component
MSATVGAQLETVERPRSLFGPDYLRLGALVLVAVAVHAWLVAHTALTARDSLGFARLVLCFENPSAAPPIENNRPNNTLDHIRAAEQPPGYPLAVWAVDAVHKQVSDRPLADRVLVSCQFANALATVLLVVPTYLLGRMLFGRNTGFAAALLFQVLPVPARITSDGLTEGVYLLVTAVALVLGVRAVRRPRISGFLLCGLATGASYLVRPEGLLLAVGPGAVALWFALTRRWPRDVALGRFTALVVGVGLVAVPYMVLIGKISNKPTAGMMNPLQGAPGRIYRGEPESKLGAPGHALLASWWNPDSETPRELWAFGAVCKETSQSGNYFVWPLAAFAVLALRRRFTTEPGLWVLVVLIGCNLALLVFMAARVGYVSERHTMLLTMLGCLLAAAGLPLFATAIGQLFPRVERLGLRVTAAGLLVALAASSLPFALKSMHTHREGHKFAGFWLAAHMTDQDAIIDPFCWAEWYSGRTLYRIPWNPKISRNHYIVIENTSTSPHSRLPFLPVAEKYRAMPGARVVYHWPENVSKEQAAIQVYKLGPGPDE